ncbi:conserved hypothetical protein [Coccidioides posadasii str. Silveira]|uniref:Uncharacterized protein n=1 Tax=Coccidioides posadasii (strain RMSCC 757 / Silveira) TaxID=443226 RepID=E9D5L8_COCPS|nr:conserved hypothetical protein [Coccidioides posadasii str. Silveira]
MSCPSWRKARLLGKLPRAIKFTDMSKCEPFRVLWIGPATLQVLLVAPLKHGSRCFHQLTCLSLRRSHLQVGPTCFCIFSPGGFPSPLIITHRNISRDASWDGSWVYVNCLTDLSV